MRLQSLVFEGRPLLHAEPVLLIHDCERQARDLERVLDQCVRADTYFDLACSDPSLYRRFHPGREGADEQGDPDLSVGPRQRGQPDGVRFAKRSMRLERGADVEEMLLRKYFGWRHQGTLVTPGCDRQHRGQRNYGLAAANFTLQQPAHRNVRPEFPQDLGEGGSLPGR